MNREVGAYVGHETICLDCLTEEERGKATEDASPYDWWIVDDEYFGGLEMTINSTCDRCGKELADWEEYQKEKVSKRIAATVYGSWKHRDKYGFYGLVVCLDCLSPEEKGNPDQQEDRYYLTKEDISRRVDYMPMEEGKKRVGSCGRCGKPFIKLDSVVKE